MSFYSEISAEKGYIIHVAIGDVNLEEAAESFHSSLKDPEFKPGMDAIWDLTSGKFGALDEEMLKHFVNSIVKAYPMRGEGQKVAVVVKDESDVRLGKILRQLTLSVMNHEMQMFQNLNDALVWLEKEA